VTVGSSTRQKNHEGAELAKEKARAETWAFAFRWLPLAPLMVPK
jgi:hypothetical protein